MYGAVKDELAATLTEIEEAGLYKRERELTTPQSSHVATTGGEALNFCANNYLGFADHPDVVAASREALDTWGFGMASVRFICGTQTQHTVLEGRLSEFLGTEATILYSSCFDANGGVFEVLFGAEDAIVSDELNHASIIDGIRLSKAARFRYKNADMADLRAQLEAARAGGARRVCVVTDGVFSMDGSFAPLDEICDLADEFEAMVLVDDSHAVGFVGDGRPWHARALRRHGPRRHRHRHPRQGARWRVGRVRRQPPRGRRAAAAALAALPVLQLGGPGGRGRVAGRPRPRVRVERGSRDVAPQRRALPTS